MFGWSLLSLLLAVPVFAVPHTIPTGCSTVGEEPVFPSNQTTLVAPTTSPNFVSLAVGVQNYTCANTSTFTNVGAVAELFDASCLYHSRDWDALPQVVFESWNDTTQSLTTQDLIAYLAPLNKSIVLGQHYFVPFNGSVNPKFDFTSARFNGNSNAFVLAEKVAAIDSPDNSTVDVAWVGLQGLEGELATQVFRTNTQGGQPPSSCTYGSSPALSVRYVAIYWFYGSTLQGV